MIYRSFLIESNQDELNEPTEFTKEDLIEALDLLEDYEFQQVGDLISTFIDEDDEDDEDLEEAKRFDTRKVAIDREKKKNPMQKKRAAKARKKWRKKNKAKVKRTQKKSALKAKRNPSGVRHHH